MKSGRYWILTLVLLLVGEATSSAQIVFQRNGFVRTGGGYVGFSKIGRSRGLSIGLGRSYRSFQSNVVIGAPVYPVARPSVRIYVAPPPVVQPRIDPYLEDALLERALFLQMNPALRPDQVRPAPPPPPQPQPQPQPVPVPPAQVEDPPAPPLQGRPAGRFRPLGADNRERAKLPIAPAKPQIKPKEQKPMKPAAVKPAAAAGPALPQFKNEKERLLFFGQQAFAQRQYGLAVERFRRAAQLDPNDGVPRLLLGQAYLAIGKYRWAHEELLDGLELFPTWPTTDFRPVDLYLENGADYEDHVQALDKALERRPDDLFLQFLAAYVRWHEGRQLEAQAIFQGLLETFPRRQILQRYLESLPDGEVL